MLTAAPLLAQKKPDDAGPRGLLKIPVWIEMENGLWTDAQRQNFKLYVDEKESPLRSFQGPKNSTIFLVVFDTVVDLARVEQARNLLGEKLRELPGNYWVGLLSSQDGLRVLHEPTADRAILIERIQTIQVNGKAGLLDTLEPVSKLAAGIIDKSGVRICVLYITDSGIGNYRADYLNPVINASDSGDLSRRFSDRAVSEQVSRIALSLKKYTIPLFILHLQFRADSLNLAYQSGLERIASASGGQTLLCRTVDEIAPGLDALFNRMKASYFLGVDFPERKKSVLKLRVEARDAEGNDLPKLTYPSQIERKR